jgi:NAD(P)-dependent dehydrogenase (short-subunit alcohol dehydrogenase family)
VLARQGASVALACRSPRKCEAAAAAVRATAAPGADVSTYELDTSSLKSVRAFAASFLAAEPRAIDMLYLNAGIASAGVWAEGAPTLPLSVDGIEMVLATNHVGHALMYKLLEARVRAAPVARVVLTSSASSFDTYSYGVATDLATLNSPPERSVAAILNPYGQSKLAQVIWAQEVARRLAADNVTNVLVTSFHPGMVRLTRTTPRPPAVPTTVTLTTLTPNPTARPTTLNQQVTTSIWASNPILKGEFLQAIVGWLEKNMMWSVRDGALTMLWLGTQAEHRSGYFHPQCEPVEPHAAAADAALAARFYEFTDELTKRG